MPALNQVYNRGLSSLYQERDAGQLRYARFDSPLLL